MKHTMAIFCKVQQTFKLSFRKVNLTAIKLIVLIVGMCLASAANAAERCENWAARLDSLEGKVNWRAATTTEWQAAKLNQVFCYGDTIKVVENRAALRLANQSVVRLKARSTLKFVAKESSFWVKLIEGAGHFLTRTTNQFVVEGPQLNASVDGTEFTVTAEGERHEVSVFEGDVTAKNNAGNLSLEAGQGTQTSGQSVAPNSAVRVKLEDAATWALYFPPVILSNTDTQAFNADLKTQISTGDFKAALETLKRLKAVDEYASLSSLQASLELFFGNVETAESLINQALKLDANSASAQALQSLITLVKGDKTEALEQTTALIQTYANDPIVHAAHSYSQQAAFDLEGALLSTKTALSLAPQNSLLLTRAAELSLNLGNTEEARDTVDTAINNAPNLARTHTISGFIAFKEQRYQRALNAFERAINLDSADPLAHFAYGLANIRQGKLIEGREKIELAVILDPTNSLFRSYLGKAYFEENRFDLASTQFDLAKQLDPNDPTPHFYQAIQLQSLNQPQKAIESIQESIALNDNRAVSRSRLMLDNDNAARTASLAEMYLELGADQLARSEAIHKLSESPTEFSSHRMIADILADDRRAEYARSSEILQAQLYQPLSAKPIRSALAETNLLVAKGAGPTEISTNEFNSLYNSDDINISLSNVTGSRNMRAKDMMLSGLKGPISFAINKYEYNADSLSGERDLEYDIGTAFLQTNITNKLNLIFEKRSRREIGDDLVERAIFDDVNESFDKNREIETNRIGFKYSPFNQWHILGNFSAISQEEQTNISTLIARTPAFDVMQHIESVGTQDAKQIELQLIKDGEQFNIISGLAGTELEREAVDTLTMTGPPPPPPPIPAPEPIVIPYEDILEHNSAYTYANFALVKNTTGFVGAAYSETVITPETISPDDLATPESSFDQFLPKLGIQWDNNNLSIRAARFEFLKSSSAIQQTIEPSFFVGFNQFYDEPLNTYSENTALAIDYSFTNKPISLGLELKSRNLEVPEEFSPDADLRKWDEESIQAYIMWRAKNISVSFSPQIDIQERTPLEKQENFQVSTPLEVEMIESPLKISFNHNSLFANATATYINQAVTYELFSTGDENNQSIEKENFINIDLEVGMTIGRYGKITLNLLNVTEEEFILQNLLHRDTSPHRIKYIPERTTLLNVNFQI